MTTCDCSWHYKHKYHGTIYQIRHGNRPEIKGSQLAGGERDRVSRSPGTGAEQGKPFRHSNIVNAVVKRTATRSKTNFPLNYEYI